MMFEVEKKFNEFTSKIKNYFASNEQDVSKKDVQKKQRLVKIISITIISGSVLVLLLFLSSRPEKKDSVTEEITEESETIELATEATKGTLVRYNYLENSIEEEAQKRQEQLDILKKSFETTNEEQQETSEKELNELKLRLSYALKEIEHLKTENQNTQNDIASLGSDDLSTKPLELGLTPIVDKVATRPPLSSFNNIPATSYVSGNLIGGIAVSTSVNTQSEPIPVVIKLTGSGNLPNDFAVNIKSCRILASCYGDISSERAIIRAEELICEDKEAGIFISTKVAGIVHGDDGANGIRGTVVSMSDKHLKNAFLGSILSGFASTAKGQKSFQISSIGAITSEKRGPKELAEEGLLKGAGNAAEKLADYHIKLAENISPVILVPGGSKVDIIFTKSVQIGAIDTVDKINNERKNHAQ